MRRIAVIANVSIIVVLLGSIIATGVRYPAAMHPTSALALIPYASVLLALNQPWKRWMYVSALALSVLLIAIGALVLVFGAAFPVAGAAIAVLGLLIPGTINILALRQWAARSRSVDALTH